MALNKNGFTLLEIVTILIIIGIMAAVAVNRMNFTDTELNSQIEAIKSNIRYAQAQSMGLGRVFGIVSNGSSYYMYQDGNTTSLVLLPAESALNVSLAEKKVNTMTSFTLSFNNLGEPYACDNPSNCDMMPASLTINVGGKASAIVVTPVTGYIR